MEAQRHGKQTRYASFFPPPFFLQFWSLFQEFRRPIVPRLFLILFFPSFRICQRFRSIDITPLCLYVSSSRLSLIYSHFSVIPITLFHKIHPNFSIFALFSYLLFLSSPSLSSISLPQRFLSNHFSPFLFLIPFLHLLLPLFYHFYLLKIPSNDIVFSLPFFFFPPLSFHVPPVSFLVQRLSLSVFLRSIIDRKPEPRSTFISRPLFSFHIYLFQLCPFCTIDRPLKFTFAPSLLVSSSSFSRLVSSASKVETVQFFHLSNFYLSPLPSRFTFFFLFPPLSPRFRSFLAQHFEISGRNTEKTCRSINFGTRHFVFSPVSFHPSGVHCFFPFFFFPLPLAPCNLRSTARPTRPPFSSPPLWRAPRLSIHSTVQRSD